ncbi:hypothetical protein KMZ30_07410 [Phycicoccus sp. KQZ13P-1]|uniref:hypothetical protein n=1 Tax=Phycicoccus mangrovi TaxID=2840470 RepID=UPI001C002E6B|nr:hypothetical protein [Phycicoccus mangrovi]MBT9255399.1 hypothetical protein [Phycicoccus mangrovi]
MSDEEQHARPFADFLREHGKGRTHDELSETLHTLIARVKDTGKKGSVTLTVVVEPMKKDDRMVVVSDQIKIRLPEHDRPSNAWFIGEDGNLQRDDPDQLPFETLREVPAPPGIDAVTGEVPDDYPIPTSRKA